MAVVTEIGVAIVAGRDVEFGVARMYEAYADRLPLEIRVFRDFEEALEWVGRQRV